jgi:hypothetical protein
VNELQQVPFSGVQAYVFDGITGAPVAVIIPGGIRWFGQAGTKSLVCSATQGMRRPDIALGKTIQSNTAITGPMSAELINSMLRLRKVTGKAPEWWLNRRGQVVR